MSIKPLNERTEEAFDAVNEAREAMEVARVQSAELMTAVRKLRKLSGKLNKLLEDAGDLFGEIEQSIDTLQSELESIQDMKLGDHVDALTTTCETLGELSELDLE